MLVTFSTSGLYIVKYIVPSLAAYPDAYVEDTLSTALYALLMVPPTANELPPSVPFDDRVGWVNVSSDTWYTVMELVAVFCPSTVVAVIVVVPIELPVTRPEASAASYRDWETKH